MVHFWPTAITIAIAVYGAILSTINAVRGLLLDKVKITVRCGEGIQFYPGEKDHFMALIIHVVNTGHRPITITAIGYENLETGAVGAPLWGLPSGDVNPKLPAYLKEQDLCVAWIRLSGNHVNIQYGIVAPYRGVWVQDGRGKKHYVDMNLRARYRRRRAVAKLNKRLEQSRTSKTA